MGGLHPGHGQGGVHGWDKAERHPLESLFRKGEKNEKGKKIDMDRWFAAVGTGEVVVVWGVGGGMGLGETKTPNTDMAAC